MMKTLMDFLRQEAVEAEELTANGRRIYPPEAKETARRRIKNGEAKTAVGEGMKIPYATVMSWTRDIKKRMRNYPPEIKQKVIERVKEVGCKRLVSDETGIPYLTVCVWTRGIGKGKGNFGIKGRTLEIMEKLTNQGYFFPKGSLDIGCCRSLKKYLPIRFVKMKNGRNIYFLKGKEDQALKAFVDRMKVKLVDYYELSQIMGAFGISREDRDFKKKMLKSDVRGLYYFF